MWLRLSPAAPELDLVAQSTQLSARPHAHGGMHTWAVPSSQCLIGAAEPALPSSHRCSCHVFQVDILVEDLVVEGQGMAAKPGGPTMTQHGIHVGSAGGGGNVGLRYCSGAFSI